VSAFVFQCFVSIQISIHRAKQKNSFHFPHRFVVLCQTNYFKILRGEGGSPGIWYVVETNFQKFSIFSKILFFLSWQRCRWLFLAKAPHEQSVTKNANFFNTEIIEFRNIYRPIFFRGGRNNYYVVSRGGVSPNTSIYYKGEGGGLKSAKIPLRSMWTAPVCRSIDYELHS
jgi:hypothetical protein